MRSSKSSEKRRSAAPRSSPRTAIPKALRSLRRWLLRLLLFVSLMPVLFVLLFRWVDPPVSSVMLQHRLAQLTGDAPGHSIEHQWVPLHQMGSFLPLAVVASEDQLFPRHMGFDTEAIKHVLSNSAAGQRLRGASTLTQQTAKNLFLWQGRSWLRKGLEAGFTLLLEGLWPKQRVLEVYLNIAEWAPDHYGAAAAARYWYGRTPDQLSRGEAARLAAILPNPRHWQAQPAGPYVAERSRWIEQQMSDLGPTWLDGIVDDRP